MVNFSQAMLHSVKNQVPLFALAMTMSFITACGFQLRGQARIAKPLQDVKIIGDKEVLLVSNALKEQLTQRGSKVNEPTAVTALTLSDPDFKQFALSVDASTSATSYEYHYQINYRLSSLVEPEKPPINGTISTSRTQSRLTNNTIGQEQADATLRERLAQDVALQLIYRLNIELASWAKIDEPIERDTSVSPSQNTDTQFNQSETQSNQPIEPQPKGNEID